MEGFIAARVMTEALKRAGNNPTRESVIRGMESLKSFDVGGFIIDFGNQTRTGSEYMEMTMIGREGKFVR
jgi:ABC-type branched-subunit amino acid transport system substrate-binding protein